jgi:hypothetical protein
MTKIFFTNISILTKTKYKQRAPSDPSDGARAIYMRFWRLVRGDHATTLYLMRTFLQTFLLLQI